MRVYIPKVDGSKRPIGIPTVRDRIVQTACKIVIEPIFEAEFDNHSYGFRPKRKAHQAIKAIQKLTKRGYVEILDADIRKYFDAIPHDKLVQKVRRRVADGRVIRLIKMWLMTPVAELMGKGSWRLTGGK
ncbi:MAG: reverse transcriptase domain-containing protein [bacterium]